jgi:dTDP-4-amino-4,6-dideoxy-D-galactose acyltransferase
MNYRVLEWDSRFFGLRTAQVTVDGDADSHNLSECLERSDAEVIYVFIPSMIAEQEQYRIVLESFAGKCYDQKITFAKQVDFTFAVWDDSIAETSTESEELLQLAYASGHLSRFFLDPRFNPHFKALYGEWIRNSLRNDHVKVLTLSDAHRIQGMVTFSIENGTGKIGLIAVDGKSQGKGLGTRLLKQCEAYYDRCSVRTCKVVTQKTNVGACKLYKKAGYTIEKEQDVWHVWKI